MNHTEKSSKNIFKQTRANGLRTNGLRANGLRTNGLRTNGLRTNGLRTNSRWKNFQKTVETEQTNTFQNKKSRFDNFDSKNQNERSSRFGQRQHSKFGKKRVYKSRYKKEETMDYFKKEKNATQRDVSLFDFTKKTPIQKKKNKPKLKSNVQESKITQGKITQDKITQAEKDFILNQYMYGGGSDDEADEESSEETNITLKIEEKKDDIIDF